MSFSIACMTIGNVRAVDERKSKAGKPFRLITIESEDGKHRNEISCTDSDLFPAVDALQRNGVYRFPLDAVAVPRRNGEGFAAFLSLTGTPVLSDGIEY